MELPLAIQFSGFAILALTLQKTTRSLAAFDL
jgi:hypothetical protein